MTTNNRGAEVYGGSDLNVVRGGFDALLAPPLSEEVALAIDQARDTTPPRACFPGLFASRRNYDVAQGRDGAGSWGSGVLEQSWRIGGASGAEIGALERFARIRRCRSCAQDARSVRRGAGAARGAVVYYSGVDESVGRIDQVCVDGAACLRAMSRSTCESRANTSSVR